MPNNLGYRRIKILCTQQVVDVPIPVANARVEGGTAVFVDVDEPKVEQKSKSDDPNKDALDALAKTARGLQTAALTPNAERAMKGKPQNRIATR